MKPTEIQTAVIASAIKDAEAKKAKNCIKVGTYSGTMVVKISYVASKGAPTDKAATSTLLSKAVLAKALVRSGIQADLFLSYLRDAAIEASNANTATTVAEQVLSEDDKRVLQRIEDIDAQVLAKIPRLPVNGSTKVVAEVDVLEAAPAQL